MKILWAFAPILVMLGFIGMFLFAHDLPAIVFFGIWMLWWKLDAIHDTLKEKV